MAIGLTEDNHRQVFVPRGFAHGFVVLSETAVFQYKCDNFYAPQADGGISIKDDSLGINALCSGLRELGKDGSEKREVWISESFDRWIEEVKLKAGIRRDAAERISFLLQLKII